MLAICLIQTAVLFAGSGSDVLIAYFTWAENTRIEDRSRAIREANTHVFSMERGSGADAVTTASVLPPGNTAMMASWIQQVTGGDLHSIKVNDLYSCYWDECLDRAYMEKSRQARPSLTETLSDLDEYEVVFLGFPTWWYTIPMAVATFVESHDFSHKTVIPFVAHGTSGTARTIRDLTQLLPSSTEVSEEIGLYRSEIRQSRNEVVSWLSDLGYR